MGLDMYLNRKIYVKKWAHQKSPTNVKVTVNKTRRPDIDTDKLAFIEEEAVYWRKANAIHKWFVDNVQDGNDDCKEYFISTEDAIDLMQTCQRVLNDHSLAPKLLPTESGFFFGSTDYDEWYYKDLEDTVKGIGDVLDRMKLAPEECSQGSLYYTASW